MALQDISPDEGDFHDADWQAVLGGAAERTCDAYARLYDEKAGEAAQGGDVVAAQVFELMCHVCSLVLKLDSTTEPLGPLIDFGPDWRGVGIDDFQDCHLVTLQAIVQEITDPELRARVADILWYHRRGGHQMAELAVNSYLESAGILEDPNDWPPCAERMERALNLAASVGRTNQPFKDVVAHIERVLDKHQGEDPLLLSARLMEMLQDHGEGDPKKYSSMAEKAALRAESEETGINWHKARRYWSVKARWHAIQGDDEGAGECQLRIAEMFVREAEDRVRQQAPGSCLAAASHIQRAIECLRRVKGTRQRREELHQQLLRYQKKAVEQFESDTVSIDVTEDAREAAERVKGKSLFEALFTLALMAVPPQVEKLRADVRDLADKHFMVFFPSARLYSDDGRVLARRSSLYSDEEDANQALRTEMLRQARNYQGLIARATIQPALAQIQREHVSRVSDLRALLQYSPFVPAGRELLFARGLHAGLTGDLVTAVHLLCPQLEHSVRVVLSRRGVAVSGLDEQGVQGMHLLNTNLSKPELVDILGEDMVFDLQGLLVEPFGSNLRNRLAHGLMDFDEFYSMHALYLWWLVLRLCLVPVYAQLYRETDSREDDENAEDGEDEGSA